MFQECPHISVTSSPDACSSLWQRDCYHPAHVLTSLPLPHPHQGPEGLHQSPSVAQSFGAAHAGVFPNYVVGQQRDRR